jgi:hypothetical protein
MSYSTTRSESFTITHARHLSSKVAADLQICSRYYGNPSSDVIDDYSEELAQMLRFGYVSRYEFGYKKDEKRVVCWTYEVNSSGGITSDDRSGKLHSTADIAGAVFYNFMWYTPKWVALPESEKSSFKKGLPISRSSGSPPADGSGYWTSEEKSYSSQNVGLSRKSFKPR